MKLRYMIFLTPLLVCSLMIIALSSSREDEEFSNGIYWANRDLASGKLCVAVEDPLLELAEPSNSEFRGKFAELLRDRYGIEGAFFSLPAHPKAAKAWVKGYNEVTKPVIEKKFGVGVLEKTKEEAWKLSEDEKRSKLSKISHTPA